MEGKNIAASGLESHVNITLVLEGSIEFLVGNVW